jgi:pimeloyl-ACP methyl ester carboxylesterase
MVSRLNQLAFLPPPHRQHHLPLFVFLPGLDGTGELLHLQTPRLTAAFDVRCLAIPGDDRSDWADLAAQVIALIQTELAGQTRPVVLCGESFGACLAMETTSRYPQWIQQLVLLNPASSLPGRPHIGWGSGLVRWLPDGLYRQSATWLLPWLAATEHVAEPEQQALLNAMQRVPQETSLWRLGLLNQFRVDAQTLPTSDLEVLLIAGTADRLLPSVSEIQRLQTYLPQAKLVTLAESGHACLLERRVDLAAILSEHCGDLMAGLRESLVPVTAPITAQVPLQSPLESTPK